MDDMPCESGWLNWTRSGSACRWVGSAGMQTASRQDHFFVQKGIVFMRLRQDTVRNSSPPIRYSLLSPFFMKPYSVLYRFYHRNLTSKTIKGHSLFSHLTHPLARIPSRSLSDMLAFTPAKQISNQNKRCFVTFLASCMRQHKL